MEEVDKLSALLQSVNLPCEPPQEMSSADFRELMSRDKKVIDGRMRLVVLDAIGRAQIVDDASEDELERLFLAK